MSLADLWKKQHKQNVPKPTQPTQPTAPPPAERKSLLEIAREAQAREAAMNAAATVTEDVPPEACFPKPADGYRLCLEASDTVGLTESKLGGVPYWETERPYPVDDDGNPMRLLLQLNMEELALHDERLPSCGLLQFFIAGDSTCNGAVIWHRAIAASAAVIDTPCMPTAEGFSPVKATARVRLERMTEETAADGHKLFGTPAFCQGDPRQQLSAEAAADYDTLLLQLDSDFNGGKPLVLWGDSGAAHYFINSDALKNCDFSKVLFYWDCY
ncbi:MAG: DUF1963 domain-containing protein [Eubacterium sp.]|nr:DUF1963 domain-containing protein [Eubacterium sp.]